MSIWITVIRVVLLSNIHVLGGEKIYACHQMKPPWYEYHDTYSGGIYCYNKDPEKDNKPRTYAEARKVCLKFGAKIVTPRGRNMHSTASVTQSDGIHRWVDVTYDHTLKMYVKNGGVPMDTSWLSWSPWGKQGPSYGRGGLDCTTTDNINWRSVVCTNTHHYVCELQLCDDGWKYNPHVDRCNQFVDDRTHTFEKATQMCSRDRAIIETPRSREAEQFLKNLIVKQSSFNTKMWIGMMNLEDEQTWRWNDGAKVTWTAWDNVTNTKHADSTHFKCMSVDVARPGQNVWYRSGCNTLKAKYVCGRISCRYPYTSYLTPHLNNLPQFRGSKQFPKCYRHIEEHVNARQAGQFCAEDGSESNPSRLFFPDHQLEYSLLNQEVTKWVIWAGYAWNRLHQLWQRQDNTFDQDPWSTLNLPRPKGAKLGKNQGPRFIAKMAFNNRRRRRKRQGWDYWSGPGRICSVRTQNHTHFNTHLRPTPCEALFSFVCEKKQPYLLTTCLDEIQNAALVRGKATSSVYYPRVPQSQRMHCYYYNTGEATMNYAEADRYCGGLGGYIMMPKGRRELMDAITEVRGSYPRWVWVGADSLGHCFNRNSRCKPKADNFKYGDGSNLTYNRWHRAQPDNWKSDEDCVSLTLRDHLMNDNACTFKRKVVCQVHHNHLRTIRNWDYLTACPPDHDTGIANWYAAPGDKCYHTITVEEKPGQNNFVKLCNGLSFWYWDTSPAKPVGKDQTRSLVLSRMMNINSLILMPARAKLSLTSHIGVMPSNKTLGTRVRYVWWPDNGTYIPTKYLNFKPGTDHTNTKDECVQMLSNGRWERTRCGWLTTYNMTYSCEKSSNPSLAKWRADHISDPDEQASRSDILRFEIRWWTSFVVTSSFLMWG